MKKLLTILCLVLLASCGPSQEEQQQAELEQQQAELEQQRLEKEASKKLAQETSGRIAAVTCAVMQETRNMDAAVRVEKINEAREKIGGEPFLSGDYAIKEAFEFGLCQELVLDENYYESLQPLKDAKRERERIAAEKRAEGARIARIAAEKRAEGKRIAAEKRAEEKRIAAEKRAEEQRIAAEKRAEEKRIAAEKRRILYEKRAEEQRIADSKPIVKEEFYSSGQLQLRTTYHSKIDGGVSAGKHGLYESFHKNGQLWGRGYYKDGEYDGLQWGYHKNGKEARGSPSCYKKGNKVDMSYCEN